MVFAASSYLLRRFRWRRILDANDPKNAQDQQQEEEDEEEEDERRGSRLSRTQTARLEREFQISAWLPAPRADEIAARLGTRRSTVKSWCVGILCESDLLMTIMSMFF